VVLAAGMSTRFGSPKQLVPVGPSGEALLDYALFDAARAGFGDAIIVVRPETEPNFQAHVAEFIGPSFPVRFVHQTLSDPRRPAPSRRTKPWGTGHAVLAAAPALSGPFAVCNADDFYGATAYRQVRDHLTARDPASAEYLVVAYRLRSTLSPHGGVSRAILELDAAGYLVRLTEVREVAGRPGELSGSTSEGVVGELNGDEPVSMNLWGFTPYVLPVLRRQFEAFVTRRGSEPTEEFLLSEALGEQAITGEARIRVVPAQESWFGLTVAADADLVRQAIGELIAGGVYPRDLREAFRNR
jgi:hypothetical protein